MRVLVLEEVAKPSSRAATSFAFPRVRSPGVSLCALSTRTSWSQPSSSQPFGQVRSCISSLSYLPRSSMENLNLYKRRRSCVTCSSPALPPASAIIDSRPVLLHPYLSLLVFTRPRGWGERRVGSLGAKSSPMRDSRTQRARLEPQKDHDLIKPRDKGDTRLEKGKFGRPQEPSSNFGKVIQERTKCISKAQEVQGGLRKIVESTEKERHFVQG